VFLFDKSFLCRRFQKRVQIIVKSTNIKQDGFFSIFFTSARTGSGKHTNFVHLVSLLDRVVNGDELGPVWKCRFHLDFMDHFRDTIHYVCTR